MEGFSEDRSNPIEALQLVEALQQVEALTRRERDVLMLLVENRSNREIAEALTIEPDSVKWYTKQIYGKLGVHDRQQAVLRARQLGLIGGEARPGAPLPCNLPAPLTTFIGRQNDVEQVLKMLANPAYRLVTLTGAGGVGKTRLALRLAEIACTANEKSVRLVELAAVSNPAMVIETVLSAFGLRIEQGLTPLIVLQNHLRTKKLLLVLDNCEHLVEACAHLVESLLKTCPDLQILATSREALGVQGETPYCVPSLSIPGAGISPGNPESLLDYEAAALFVERASQALPGFELLPGYTEAIVRICQRLDGIPLALELAAARVKLLSVEQIANRLEESFSLLAGGSRTSLPRHQTMQATLDWSYHLLSAAERTVLQRLTVFAGGWTLDAAEWVCGAPGSVDLAVLVILGQLVNKSLVVVDGVPGKMARYRLLETTRQYGRDRLIEAGDETQTQNRHLDFFCRMAQAAAPHLSEAPATGFTQQLAKECPNLQAALAWSVSAGDQAQNGLRLAAALTDFWERYNFLVEGREWLETLLVLAGDEAAPDVRAAALQGAGKAAYWQNDFVAARAYFEQSLALDRTLNNLPGMAETISRLGLLVSTPQEWATARAYLEEGLAISRVLGDPRARGLILGSLGHMTFRQGDCAQGRSMLEESLSLLAETGDQYTAARMKLSLSHIDRIEGKYAQARERCADSLKIARDFNMSWGYLFSLNAFGCLAVAEGQFERAVRLLSASEHLGKDIGASLVQTEIADHEANLAVARAALGDAAFAAAWAEGQSMTSAQAAAYALDAALE